MEPNPLTSYHLNSMANFSIASKLFNQGEGLLLVLWPGALESQVSFRCSITLLLMHKGWGFGLQGHLLGVGEDR